MICYANKLLKEKWELFWLHGRLWFAKGNRREAVTEGPFAGRDESQEATEMKTVLEYFPTVVWWWCFFKVLVALWYVVPLSCESPAQRLK